MKRLFVLLLILTAPSALAQNKTLADGIDDLSRQVKAGLGEGTQRVAVMPLRDLDGNENNLGAFLAEEVGTILVTQKVEVVERALLGPVMSELKFQASGAIDEKTAQKIGKLSGADAIVTGTITELPSSLRINCRVIATKTGRVIAGARTQITIDGDVEALRQSKTAAKPKPKPAASRGAAPANSWEAGGVRIVVDGATVSGRMVKVPLALEHGGDTTLRAQVGRYHLIDENGDLWSYTDDTEDFVKKGVSIPPGTRARSTFVFRCKSGHACNGTVFNVVTESDDIVLSGLRIPRQ
ncbi:MAG TPA: FlgO family outer membrane protein [Thermoanaerobaculia bacterium]